MDVAGVGTLGLLHEAFEKLGRRRSRVSVLDEWNLRHDKQPAGPEYDMGESESQWPMVARSPEKGRASEPQPGSAGVSPASSFRTQYDVCDARVRRGQSKHARLGVRRSARFRLLCAKRPEWTCGLVSAQMQNAVS